MKNLFLILIAFCIFGCTPDEPAPEPMIEIEETLLLKEMSTVGEDSYSTYTYDSEDRISLIESRINGVVTISTNYTYSGDTVWIDTDYTTFMTRKKYFIDSNGALRLEEYDGDELTAIVIHSDFDAQCGHRLEEIYNADNILLNIVSVEFLDSNCSHSTSSILIPDYDGPILTFTKDDKNNALKGTRLSLWNTFSPSVGNQTAFSRVHNGDTLDAWEYTYQYNSDDYPISSTLTYTAGSQSGTVYDYTYTYY